jgi:uncharacterized protein YbcI
METSNPIRGQLELKLSQRIQALYRTHLEHQPTEVVCQIFDNKVAIILENSVTRPVQLLVERNQQELAEKVRFNLYKTLEPQLKTIIQEVLGVPVIDLLSDAKLDSGRSGTIAVLAETPNVRDLARPETASEDGAE